MPNATLTSSTKDPPQESGRPPVKITMNLPGECVETIKRLAARLQIPNSHVVRRAVDFRARIQDEIDAGAKVFIERDGQLMSIWFE